MNGDFLDTKARPTNEIVQLAAFRVGDEEYVVDIMRVREIIRMQPITQVRRGPKFVEGVLNLRGAVIPVIDMRRRFELGSSNKSTRKIIIVLVDGRTIGLVVDQVTDVVRVPRASIKAAPALLGTLTIPHFLGICYHKDRTLVLLNVRAILADDPPSSPMTPSERQVPA